MAKQKATGDEKKATKKTVCEVNRAEFAAEAKGLLIDISGTHVPRGTIALTAAPREFGTGSLGWYVNGPHELSINGVPVKVQIQMTVTVANSKELPK